MRRELADHVFGTQEIGLRRFQPQFGLVAPGMQTGNTGGFLEDAAALLRLGLDDLADAALVHEGRRAGTGRGVGKEDLDIARTDLAPVDAIVGAGIAFDATGNFERSPDR